MDTPNYEAKWAELQQSLEADEARKTAFLRNPVPELESAGIPVVPTLVPATPKLDNLGKMMAPPTVPEAAGALEGGAEQISASTHWWGVDITMNEKLTQDVISGLTAAGPLGSLIGGALGAAGVVTGGIATVIGAGLAAVFALKTAQMKITDNGKGVHFPITWPQWAVLAASVPAGPAGIVGAAMAFVHPLRN